MYMYLYLRAPAKEKGLTVTTHIYVVRLANVEPHSIALQVRRGWAADWGRGGSTLPMAMHHATTLPAKYHHHHHVTHKGAPNASQRDKNP